MQIRQLAPADAAMLRALRIRAVTEYPSAFSASVDEETAQSVDQVAQQLADGLPTSRWFGAFDAADLLGMVNLVRFQRHKVRHKAMLGTMYVVPERQGQGVGAALLQHALTEARAVAGIQFITLAVTVGNHAARRLYMQSGFVPYGIEPSYIRVGDDDYDIEWLVLDVRQAGTPSGGPSVPPRPTGSN